MQRLLTSSKAIFGVIALVLTFVLVLTGKASVQVFLGVLGLVVTGYQAATAWEDGKQKAAPPAPDLETEKQLLAIRREQVELQGTSLANAERIVKLRNGDGPPQA